MLVPFWDLIRPNRTNFGVEDDGNVDPHVIEPPFVQDPHYTALSRVERGRLAPAWGGPLAMDGLRHGPAGCPDQERNTLVNPLVTHFDPNVNDNLQEILSTTIQRLSVCNTPEAATTFHLFRREIRSLPKASFTWGCTIALSCEWLLVPETLMGGGGEWLWSRLLNIRNHKTPERKLLTALDNKLKCRTWNHDQGNLETTPSKSGHLHPCLGQHNFRRAQNVRVVCEERKELVRVSFEDVDKSLFTKCRHPLKLLSACSVPHHAVKLPRALLFCDLLMRCPTCC